MSIDYSKSSLQELSEKQNNANFSIAFSSQYKELALDKLKIDGKVPNWLSGNFISNGPAQFEVGSTAFNHWFDGFAMLKKFSFKEGNVCFQNRFLRSKEYIESVKIGKLSVNEFATYASNNILKRIGSGIKNIIKSDYHDNCIVNTNFIAKQYIAMTETNDILAFNIKDLTTSGRFNLLDKVPGQLTLAHPHWDITKNELINISVEVGPKNKYHIYKICQHSKEPKIISTYVSKNLFYNHSFSITKNVTPHVVPSAARDLLNVARNQIII